MANDPIKVTVETLEGATVVSPEGEIDLSCSAHLRSKLQEAVSAGPKRIVVDLNGVGYMDSSGIATLVEALQMARRDEASLVICSLTERVKSIIELARLDQIFEIAVDRDAALVGT